MRWGRERLRENVQGETTGVGGYLGGGMGTIIVKTSGSLWGWHKQGLQVMEVVEPKPQAL